MGSGQSARKLTINNEEIDVIEISESVVERLTQKMNEEKPNVANEVRSATLTDSKKTASSQLSQSDIPVNAGYPIYQPQLTLTAIKYSNRKKKNFEIRIIIGKNVCRIWNKNIQKLIILLMQNIKKLQSN